MHVLMKELTMNDCVAVVIRDLWKLAQLAGIDLYSSHSLSECHDMGM